jgi:hypothetical protein
MTDCIRCWKLTDKPVTTFDGELVCQECYEEIYALQRQEGSK